MTAARIAVVTGGLGGLGTAICRALAEAGRKVVAVDVAAPAERVAGFRAALNGFDAHVETADVADFDACAALVRKVEDAHGALDILVNNAGITRDSTLRKMEPAQWQAVIDVNLSSAFNLCRHSLEGMQARGFGRIVNISSVSGQTGNFGQTNYAAAKAGLHGFSMSLARETATKGVTVNSISPGYIETPMTLAMPEAVREKTRSAIPIGRLGQPQDIARTVAFLTADDAGYITGANIPVNGGLYMAY